MTETIDDLAAVRLISETLEGFEPAERERILRWVAERAGLSVQFGKVSQGAEPIHVASKGSLDPRRLLQEAIAANDIGGIRASLQRFQKIEAVEGQVAAAAALAVAGEADGADFLRKVVREATVPDRLRQYAIGGLAQYYVTRDEGAVGLGVIEPLVIEQLSRQIDSADRAFYANQLGRLYYGAGRFQDAFKAQSEAASLNPGEATYQYNLSLVAEKLGRFAEAAQFAKAAADRDDFDVDHLRHAVETLTRIEDARGAAAAFEKLRGLDPTSADRLLRELPSLRRMVRHE